MKLLLLASLLLLSVLSVYGDDKSDLVVKSANRLIDLDSQFARHLINFTFENTGSSPVSVFYLAVQEEKASNLALIAIANPKTNKTEQLSPVPSEVSEKRVLFKVSSPDLSVEPGATVQFEALLLFTHTMKPLPATIKQNEKQFVRYEDHAYIFSPYTVKSQTTQFKLASSSVESFFERPPTTQKENIVVYGPYNDIAPFTRAKIHVHFENNKPFITVTNFVRELEVSHWGNLAVEETLSFQHDGAKHKGSWSRWDYQRNSYQNIPQPAVASLTEVFPADATDFYYRDEIGNISTSQYFATEDAVNFVFKPRFPLFGGWKTSHYHGFNLPLEKFLFTDYNDGSAYTLNFTFAPLLLDSVIDHLTIRVILPEGATNIQLHTPFPVENEGRSLHFTYLDTVGRPVVTFEKRNVVPELKGTFRVTYNFSRTSLLREPLLLIGGYFILLFFFILYLRIDLNLQAKDEKTERVSALLVSFKEEVYDVYAKAFASVEEAFKKYQAGSVSDAEYRNTRTQAEATLTKANEEFKEIASQLEEVGTPVTSRVNELKKHLTEKLKHLKLLHDNDLNTPEKARSIAYNKIKQEETRQYELSDEEADRVFNDLFEKVN